MLLYYACLVPGMEMHQISEALRDDTSLTYHICRWVWCHVMFCKLALKVYIDIVLLLAANVVHEAHL